MVLPLFSSHLALATSIPILLQTVFMRSLLGYYWLETLDLHLTFIGT